MLKSSPDMRREAGVLISAAIALGGCNIGRPTETVPSGRMDTGIHMVRLTSRGQSSSSKPNLVSCFTSEPIIVTRADQDSTKVRVVTTDAECYFSSDEGAYNSADNIGIKGPNPIQIVDVFVDSATVQDNPYKK